MTKPECAFSFKFKPPYLAAFGNPLVDLCVQLCDTKLLKEFSLPEDGQLEVSSEKMTSILKRIERFPKKSCPGGSALNTLRIFQWLVGERNCSIFFGSTGVDENGQYLQSCVQVQTRFSFHPDYSTGTTIALIHDDFRTLVAHLGAAEIYQLADLQNGDNLKIINQIPLIYIENFFLSHSKDVVEEIIKICKNSGTAIAFNLSGSYLFEKGSAEITNLVKYANIVIGNKNEYKALAKCLNMPGEDLENCIKFICNEGVQTLENSQLTPLKLDYLQHLGKIVVATQGPNPVLCCQGGNVSETAVLPPLRGIFDSTGAGDAFAAGLLLGILKERPLSDCVGLGCYASNEIIQQIGCCVPDYPPLIC